MTKSALFTLLTLFSASQLASALQVTPNSPCASECLDSLDLDFSDPNSSNTRNSDIICQDDAFSSAEGSKFKSCMTCLQTSTFSQGSESDSMWFLYNLRYTTAFCLFGYPNATDVSSTPCTIEEACGRLKDSIKHGIPDPRDTTAYSYCSAGGGEAMDFANYESCIPCLAAGQTTDFLANYFVALEAGCRQQPAPGVRLGLDGTIFSEAQITIVDPTTLLKVETEEPALPVPVIVGISAGALVLILIVAGVTFVCLRKRKNKRARASAKADFYARVNRQHHRSSMSFQCQTHMASPRHWPGAGAAGRPSTHAVDSPEMQAHQSAMWTHQETTDYHHQEDHTTPVARKPAPSAAPLQITTTVSPAPPPQAYTSPSSASERVYHSPSDFRTPLSAESVRSTSALLPSIRPYIPADHGVHNGQPASPASFSSPISATATTPGGAGTGTGMTPLLRSGGWPLPEHTPAPVPQQQQHQNQNQNHHATNRDSHAHAHALPQTNTRAAPPPPPPQIKTLSPRGSSGLLAVGRKSPKPGGVAGAAGSPVESREIQTSAFAAPPRR